MYNEHHPCFAWFSHKRAITACTAPLVLRATQLFRWWWWCYSKSAPWSARGPPRIDDYQAVYLGQVHGLEARHYLGSCAEAVLPTFHALCKASTRLDRHVSTIGDKRTATYYVKLKAYYVHFIAHCMACLVMHACDHVSKERFQFQTSAEH